MEGIIDKAAPHGVYNRWGPMLFALPEDKYNDDLFINGGTEGFFLSLVC
jgi:hypothetical protein